jgi:uncharacterized protein YceH (UPF0502 family)
MDLDEEAVRQALHGLEDLRLAGRARGADSRVTKYEHWLGEAFNFSRAETALLCVLLLRGPQTPGELRGRTERLHRFEEISDVMAGLQKLIDREPALVAVLARQPGSREARYAHLLSGAVANQTESGGARLPGLQNQENWGTQPLSADQEDRVARLEGTVAELQREVAELRKKFEDLFA